MDIEKKQGELGCTILHYCKENIYDTGMENDEIGKEKAPETSQPVQSEEVTRANREPKGPHLS